MDLVQGASADELRAVVLALCKDASIQTKFAAHLKKLRDAQANAVKTGEKRKASDQFFICVRCGETFSEETNNSKACTYHHGKCSSPGEGGGWECAQFVADRPNHSGEMEVGGEDEDFWADHDEDCHGEIDTESMREEFPDGFTWDCCNKVGTAPGCTKGHHYAIEGKRMKVTTDADSVSDDSDR